MRKYELLIVMLLVNVVVACPLCEAQKDITEIVVVLDRSGSMVDIQGDMVGGLKQFISDQQKCDGKANFTLVQFDTEYETVYEGVDIQDVNEISLVPRGWTALLDAIGRTIEETSNRLAKIDPDRKVVFVIITDGLENSSKEFDKSTILEKIKHFEQVHSWKFIYLGANQDAIKEGTSLGINYQNCSNFTPDNLDIVLCSASEQVTAYRLAKDPNEKEDKK
jgi:uncharacterized protein YegL